MNLFQITSGHVAAVNPMVPATLRINSGYTKDANFNRAPTYSTISVQAQVQSLTFRDIQQIDGLNLQGTRRAIYLEGDVEGLVRVSQKGGDLITMPDGSVWLVAMVLEAWLQNLNTNAKGWCKVAVTLQDGS